MITNLEEITEELTKEEIQLLKPLIKGFSTHGVNNPIKTKEIILGMNHYTEMKGLKIKMTGARLRKMVNFIRVNGLLPVIGTSRGYYVSYNKAELAMAIDSLEERARSISNAAIGLRKIRDKVIAEYHDKNKR